MQRYVLVSVALLGTVSACASGPGEVSPDPPYPPEDVVPADPREPTEGTEITVPPKEYGEARGTMIIWLENFRDAQRRYHKIYGRFCEELSCDGEIERLPGPLKTSYWPHQAGWRYLVEVRYPDGRLTCKLEDGRESLETGEVVCRQQ